MVSVAPSFIPSDYDKIYLNIGFQLVGKNTFISTGPNNIPQMGLNYLKIVVPARRSCMADLEVAAISRFDAETKVIETLVETNLRDWNAHQGENGKWYKTERYDNDGIYDDINIFLGKMSIEKGEEVCLIARAQQRNGGTFYPVLVRSFTSPQQHYAAPARFKPSSWKTRNQRKSKYDNFSDDGWGETKEPAREVQRCFKLEWLSISWADFMKTPVATSFILTDLELNELTHPDEIAVYQPSRSLFFVLQTIHRALKTTPLDLPALRVGMKNLYGIIEKCEIISAHPLMLHILDRIRQIVPVDSAKMLMSVHDEIFTRPEYGYVKPE